MATEAGNCTTTPDDPAPIKFLGNCTVTTPAWFEPPETDLAVITGRSAALVGCEGTTAEPDPTPVTPDGAINADGASTETDTGSTATSMGVDTTLATAGTAAAAATGLAVLVAATGTRAPCTLLTVSKAC